MDENNKIEPKEEEKLNKMTPETVGTIKDNKKGGPVALLIIVILLIACVFGLPYIKDFINNSGETQNNNIKDNSVDNPIIPSPEIPSETDDQKEFFEVGVESTILLDGITISNISLNKETANIELKVNNSNEKPYDYEENNIYLELYNLEKTLLERIKINYKNALDKGINYNISLPIKTATLENAFYLKIIKYEESDYPNITLNMNENNEELLVCIKENQKITYIFKEQLIKINDVYSYAYSDNLEEYTANLNSYKEKATKMNEKAGITSSVVESNLTFIYNTIIDLSLSNVAALEESAYYSKKVLPKVINFEMESSGYNCN